VLCAVAHPVPFNSSVANAHLDFMGLSVRTDAWRFTMWYPWDKVNKQPEWGADAVPRELYNHTGDDGTDFDAFENVNLAGVPELAATETAMRNILLEHFQQDGGTGWGPSKLQPSRQALYSASTRDPHHGGGASSGGGLVNWFRKKMTAAAS